MKSVASEHTQPSISPGRLYIAVTLLYIVQKLPEGAIRIGLPLLLARLGYQEAAIGSIVGSLIIPWALKPIWGPLVDKYGTKLRWLLFAQLLAGCFLIPAGLLAPTGAESLGVTLSPWAIWTLPIDTYVTLLTVLIIGMSTSLSVQDVAVDTLCIQMAPENKRGLIGTLMNVGWVGGLFIGGALGPMVAVHLGWGVMFHGLAGLLLLILGLVAILGLHERKEEKPAVWPLIKLTARSFWCPSVGLLVLAALIYQISYGATQGLLPLLLKNVYHYADDRVGLVKETFNVISVLAAFVVGSRLIDRLGRKRTLVLFVCCTAGFDLVYATLSHTAIIPPGEGGRVPLWALLTLRETMAWIGTASVYALFMDIVQKQTAGTMFTAYMAICNIGMAVGAAVGGWIVQHHSWPRLYLYGALLYLVAAVLFWLVREDKILSHNERARMGGNPSSTLSS